MQLNKCKFKEYIQKNKCLCEECKGMEYQDSNAPLLVGAFLGWWCCCVFYSLALLFFS